LCLKTKPLNRFFHNLISELDWDSFKARVILDVLIYIHSLKDQIVLGRVPYQLSSLVKVCEQVKSSQTKATYCW
jgi:hypothetical protein